MRVLKWILWVGLACGVLLVDGSLPRARAGGLPIYWCALCGDNRHADHDFTHGRGRTRYYTAPQRTTVMRRRTYPNVVRQADGTYRPKRGYTWVTRDPGDLRVRPLPPPGTPHEVWPNVVYAGGGVQPRFGYRFVGDVRAGDYRVAPIPAGTRHAYYANVEWDGAGNLTPADGYMWASPAVGDYRVVRIPRAPPKQVNPIDDFVTKRDREHRRRSSFELGMRAFERGDFERAVVAFRTAVALSPDNRKYQVFLLRAEQGVVRRERQALVASYRRQFPEDPLRGTRVPPPRITERYYVTIPALEEDWFRFADPLLDLANATLRQAQDAAHWARDVAWNQIQLRADEKLKHMPGYDLYSSFKQLEEDREHLQRGYADRVLRMAKRNLRAVERAVQSAGRGGGDPLAEADADFEAFLKTAEERVKQKADATWAPSALEDRRPTRKAEETEDVRGGRHARGFEVDRWRAR